jgi:superfamily II DNA or RNA helicase
LISSQIVISILKVSQMSLINLSLPLLMDTSSADIIADFFIPALGAAARYDRGVGYFTSGWLRTAAAGMVAFAGNGGRARWVTSPILDEADWEALQAGDAARTDPILRATIVRNIDELASTLERETLSALAWMIADEIITFKLALPRNKLERGNFHDKFGIFTDAESNQVSFNGSYNDSIQGNRNYESIKIFCSWHQAFAPLVQGDAKRFERLWSNLDPNVRIFDLPEADQERILSLRTTDRPYRQPQWVKIHHEREFASIYRPARPAVPGVLVLREYQLEAINSWFDHNCQGFFEMATGTGKTITALAASARLYEQENQLAVIIVVPYQHLVDQWHEEAKTFGYQPVLAYQSRMRWQEDLNNQIFEYNSGYKRFVSVITTHNTFITPEFQSSISRLNSSSLLIADEAHHLGSEHSRQSYPEHFPFRLALSATPERWFDALGTATLRNYFGETVFAFPLEKAIGVCLTPYYYHPHLVPLTDEELGFYEELSAKIARLFNRQDEQGQQALKLLLIRRAELLNKATNKLTVLSELVRSESSIDHTLFYCAPGQIDQVMRILGWEMGLLVHRFTAEETAVERQQLLAEFASGNLQALVAMKCLDEGVDVPSTRTAYILASSSNPREFIQRRGRILRKFEGKEFSVIHDLIAVPPLNWAVPKDSPTFSIERNIIRRELQRFKEFATPAINKHQALDVVWNMAKQYGLMDF